MIEFAKSEIAKSEIDALLNPFVRSWFSKFKELTPPQTFAIKLIHEGKNVLISAPTGSGKTMSAFLSIINELCNLSQRGQLEDKIYCIYISPLRALNRDIKINLEEPLSHINGLAGDDLPNVRIGVRTGDTTLSERAQQSKNPPHIYITTPESLAIVLNSPKFIQKLKDVKWIIIDEIHALCSNKRGVHLSLTIERLQHECNNKFQRIGLSATINPLEEVAKYLIGGDDNCTIVNTPFIKKTDIQIISPVEDLILTSTDKINELFYKRLFNLISDYTTSLIFTNTRSGTERVLFHLQAKFPSLRNKIAAHHSSIAKDSRFNVENALKRGELKAVSSSTSLELGIDIGYIGLVIQLASPKSVSRLLQRIGRSGHALHETSVGRILITDRDELVECAVMINEAYKGRIDKIQIPTNCLDVLCQHLLGMSLTRTWTVIEAYALIKKSYCYANFSKNSLITVLEYLSGKNYELNDQKVYGKIWYDPIENTFGRKGKLSRMIYLTNVGTIPETSGIKVYANEEDGSKTLLGSLDEEFVERLEKNDRFVMGGKTYEFRYVKGMIATVDKAWDRQPTIPSWVSEMLPLSFDSAISIGKFREKMFNAIKSNLSEEIIKEIKEYGRTDDNAANAIYNYFKLEYNFLKQLGVKNYPSHNVILVEHYLNDGKQSIILHSLYGRRVNDALSRALAFQLSKAIKRSVQVSINDNGFALTFSQEIDIHTGDVLKLISAENLETLLEKSLEKTELLKRRFRHVATRGLMILKQYMNENKSVGKRQISAGILLSLAKEIQDFPIMKETYREILEDVMDLQNTKLILTYIKQGKIVFELAKKSPVPSPFSHNLILEGINDIINTETKREFLERLHKQVTKVIYPF